MSDEKIKKLEEKLRIKLGDKVPPSNKLSKPKSFDVEEFKKIAKQIKELKGNEPQNTPVNL